MKNKYKHSRVFAAICFLFLISALKTSAQEDSKTITGTVSDQTGPLQGASILLKNKTKGTTSDTDGYYSITAKPSDTLVFSYLGHQTTEVAVELKSSVNVTLVPNETSLAEVVINAGYYKVSDREKTGTISRVTALEIEKQVTTNPISTLQGKIAGLHIIQNSGIAGSGFKIQLRGKNSLTAGNNPLFIIDGVPFNTEIMGSRNITGGIILDADFSPFNFLNPGDVESIEVLKDADATAIYGSRGANGVILITTKKNHNQGIKYSFSSKTGIGRIAKKQKLLNTDQYLIMRRKAFENDGITDYPFAYDINGTWDQTRNTDWQKEFLGGTAWTKDHQISTSAGYNNFAMYLSGGYYEESSIFPSDDSYKKASGLSKINYTTPDDRVNISLSTAYTYENNDLPAMDLNSQALILAPNAPNLYAEDGKLNWENGTFSNPLGALEAEVQSQRNSLLINSEFRFKILNELYFKLNSGFQNVSLSEYRTSPHTIHPPSYSLTSKSSVNYTNDANRSSWILEPQLSFSHKWKNSTLESLMGMTAENERFSKIGLFARGFASNAQIKNLAAADYIAVLDDSKKEYKYQAFFGRINYKIYDRYLINLTGRRDGSSRFGPNNRFSQFGAVGVSWIFSDEKLVKQAFPFLSYGKLRSSWGTTGNDQIGDYQYLNSYSSSGTSYNGTIGIYPTSLYNPDFGWEINKKKEFAIELGFLENKILVNVNNYRNKSSNQLVEIPLPGTTGHSGVLSNLKAVVENKGWEIEFKTFNISHKNFSWNTAFNMTIPKNKLLEFPHLESSTYANRYEIGKPITIVKLLHLTGVNPETGTYSFEDVNGDGEITIPEDSQTIMDLAPKFYGGITNSLTIGNFEIDLFFQFSKQMTQNIKYLGVTPGTMFNQPIDVLNAWNNPGDSAEFQGYTSGANYDRLIASYYLGQSDAAYSDAAFIRLKNISVAYNLNNLLSKNSSMKIFLQGQNFYTWSSYTGQDPEQKMGYSPILRWMSAGIKLTF